MAEFVQHRLEEGLPELREMQKVGIFNGKEIKVIVKKRKVFEYRMQRRMKSKDDFLKYIKYEISLLKLLRLRRKKLGIGVDYRVDFAITNRINVLFRKAIIRYKSDVKLWLSNIEFCRQVRWMESVSRLYASMLRVHSDKPELWVAAAMFDFDTTHSAATARNLFLRGLRFHPESKLLYSEYFRMELLNADLKRETLKMSVTESIGGTDPITDFEEECTNDPVLSGAVAMTVYRNATKIIPEGSFASSFLDVSKTCELAHHLRVEIYEDLLLRFADDEHARAAVAKRHLYELSDTELFEASSTKNIEVQCFQGFEKAVKDVPTGKMWTLYIQFCLERLERDDTDEARERRRIHVVRVFSRAADKQLLPLEYYLKWMYLADSNERSCILKMATKRFPQNVRFWRERISHLIGRDKCVKKKISRMFDTALKAIPSSEAYAIVLLSLHWHMLEFPGNVIDMFEQWSRADVTIASKIKTKYLEWVFTTQGIKVARKLYRRLWSAPPITLDFFFAAINMELSTLKPSIKRLRDIMDTACRNYGTSSVDLWLRYTDVESRFADDIGRVGHIHWRAVKTLEASIVDQFVAHRTLSQNNVTE